MPLLINLMTFPPVTKRVSPYLFFLTLDRNLANQLNDCQLEGLLHPDDHLPAFSC